MHIKDFYNQNIMKKLLHVHIKGKMSSIHDRFPRLIRLQFFL